MKPIAAKSIPADSTRSLYPEPFASLMEGRSKRKLGNYFGLVNFGVNLTELAPGALSALKHHHVTQDEFIYILQGAATLIYGSERFEMNPGDCFGFPKNSGIASQLRNDSDERVIYLEIGDRSPNDHVAYPDDDLQARCGDDGVWWFYHNDGTPYE